jgi:hypothetical protein
MVFKTGSPWPGVGSSREDTARRAHDPASSASLRKAERVQDPFDRTSARCRCLVRILATPGSDSLEALHHFLADYAAKRFLPQVGQRMSVACYELAANALSYSSMSSEVCVELFEVPDAVAIRMTNDTIGPRISMLTDHVAKLRQSAEQVLVEEMRRSVAGGPVRPMLGLARVMHEANMQLDFAVKEQRVTLTASCRK